MCLHFFCSYMTKGCRYSSQYLHSSEHLGRMLLLSFFQIQEDGLLTKQGLLTSSLATILQKLESTCYSLKKVGGEQISTK